MKVEYGEPLGRPLKVPELTALLTAAPDHLRLMLMLLIGTACRPEAALELTGAQLDFEDGLIADRHQRLRQRDGERMQAGAPSAGENNGAAHGCWLMALKLLGLKHLGLKDLGL